MSKKYNSWQQLQSDVDQDEINLNIKKETSFLFYSQICNTVNDSLSSQNYKALSDLVALFESPEIADNIIQSGDMRKIYIIALFTKVELKNNLAPFVSNLTDYQNLLCHYMQTIFALRRIEVNLNDSFAQEAYSFLNELSISAYAISGLLENEYFERTISLYWAVYKIKKAYWSISEKGYWLGKLIELGDESKAYLELSSLCLENHDYSQAYSFLTKIKNPSVEIVQLIQTLKGVLELE